MGGKGPGLARHPTGHFQRCSYGSHPPTNHGLPCSNLPALPCSAPLPRPAADHFLHTINRDFLDSDDVEANIQKLVAQYEASAIAAHVKDHVAALQAGPGQPYKGGIDAPGWGFQTSILTYRTFLNK